VAKHRAGLALIIAIGILVVATVLAVCFVTLARLERRASQRRIHQTQALFLARSGLEDAQARMASGQDPSLQQNRYGGEDADLSSGFSGVEAAQEIHRRGKLDAEACPLVHALRPSFPALSGAAPRLLAVDGRQRGFSGSLAADPGSSGASYALNVEDESGKINVNGGLLDSRDRDGDLTPDCRDPDVRNPLDPKDTGRGWNAQLARILNLLGSEIGGPVNMPTLGLDVVSRRPPGGYPSLTALQEALSTTTDLSPWLTTRSWADVQVVHPNGYGTQDATLSFPGLNDVKRDRRPLALEEGGRPPVNLNAAPRNVLSVLMQNLKGTSWHSVGTPRSFQITPGTGSIIASRIVARRAVAPFASWSDFSAFCDTLVSQDVITGLAVPAERWGGGNLCGADLVKANFDPNTALNKQLPDQILWRWIDKSDLSVWSTEGSLGPTGTFRISSLGRVLDPGGRILAMRSLAVTVDAFHLLRQTTQQDFVSGRPLDECFSLSPGGPYGYRTTGATASWRGAGWGDGRGLAALSYPCAPTAPASRLDGYLALATVQEGHSRPGLRFLHHLDDSLDADVGTPTAVTSGVWSSSLQTDLAQDIWPAPPVEPSTFLPDGLHSQRYRSPGYQAFGNFPASGGGPVPSNHGVISYWVKLPNAQWSDSGVGRYPWQFSCTRYAGSGLTQTLAIGEREFFARCWGLLLENSVSTTDAGHEHATYASNSEPTPFLSGGAFKPGLRWNLVTAWFDTDEALAADEASMDIRGVRPFTSGPGYLYTATWTTADGQDLFVPGVAFALGNHPQALLNTVDPGTSNQIIDEVAICDFGDDVNGPTGTRIRAADLARQRYADGRYYKGDDARFLSAVLEPDSGRPVRLLSARWTEYLPRDSRQEMLSVNATIPMLPPYGGPAPRLIDARLLDSRLELDLLDEAGGLSDAPRPPLTQGGSLSRSLRRFRYRVAFRNTMADPDNQGVLETPFLDDITFAWQPADGPRVLAWGE